MLWLALGGWAAAVTLLVGLAILVTVGQAFGRRHGAGDTLPLLAKAVLSPGLRLGNGNVVAILAIAWLAWFAAGAAAILALHHLG